MTWNPQHVVLTGASSGIGAGLARALAAPGRRLSLAGRHAERLAAVAESCTAAGAEITVEHLDIRDATASACWIERCAALAPIDLLVANAGISGAMQAGPSDPGAIIDVNVRGVINTIVPALPMMIERKAGQIAVMSSLAGFRGLPNACTYCASKAAVRVYGEGLRARLRRHDIRVNVICPGFVETPLTDANPFAMPLLMPVDRAVATILKGLARNRGLIAFPWQTYWFVRLLAILPSAVVDRWFARMPDKE